MYARLIEVNLMPGDPTGAEALQRLLRLASANLGGKATSDEETMRVVQELIGDSPVTEDTATNISWFVFLAGALGSAFAAIAAAGARRGNVDEDSMLRALEVALEKYIRGEPLD
jgi:hypothetical protein